MGPESLSGEMNKSWRRWWCWLHHSVSAIEAPEPFKVVRVVNFMLCIFCHNEKKPNAVVF